MVLFPVLRNSSTIGQFGSFFVGAWNELEASVLGRLRVDDHHDLHERHLAHVVVGRCVYVGDKPIGAGQLIVDLILEYESILRLSA